MSFQHAARDGNIRSFVIVRRRNNVQICQPLYIESRKTVLSLANIVTLVARTVSLCKEKIAGSAHAYKKTHEITRTELSAHRLSLTNIVTGSRGQDGVSIDLASTFNYTDAQLRHFGYASISSTRLSLVHSRAECRLHCLVFAVCFDRSRARG